MLPKILRMRLDAVGRVSGAGAALVAMGVVSPLFPSVRQEAGVRLASASARRVPEPNIGAQKRRKPQVPWRDRSFQRPDKPHPINALNARRDDASCSDGRGVGAI